MHAAVDNAARVYWLNAYSLETFTTFSKTKNLLYYQQSFLVCGYLLVIVLPTNSVSLPGKHAIPLSPSTSLNSLILTIFRPHRILAFFQYKSPHQTTRYYRLLATFPLRPFLCLHLLLGTLYTCTHSFYRQPIRL